MKNVSYVSCVVTGAVAFSFRGNNQIRSLVSYASSSLARSTSDLSANIPILQPKGVCRCRKYVELVIGVLISPLGKAGEAMTRGLSRDGTGLSRDELGSWFRPVDFLTEGIESRFMLPRPVV